MNDAPDAKLTAVLAAFAAGRAALEGGIRTAVLAGGLENSSYRVTSKAGDWVVRLAGTRDARFAINRVAERQAQSFAAAAGFAPAIVHGDAEYGILISEYLDAAVWSREQARTPDGLRLLGTRLGELHALEVPRTVRRVNLHDVLAHYLELPATGATPISREDIGARLRWSLATYKAPASALCHNDPHHLNLLGTAPLRFVDWEYAGVGDPIFELAAVIGYHDLDVEQRGILLAAHGGGFAPAHVTRMCLVFDCLHALWLDAAAGWDSLGAERREALIARLTIDPAERRR